MGYILAVASAIPFLVREARPVKARRQRRAIAPERTVAAPQPMVAVAAAEARSIE